VTNRHAALRKINELRGKMSNMGRRALATRRACASDWREFTAWCAARPAITLPAEPALVAAFLAWMATLGPTRGDSYDRCGDSLYGDYLARSRSCCAAGIGAGLSDRLVPPQLPPTAEHNLLAAVRAPGWHGLDRAVPQALVPPRGDGPDLYVPLGAEGKVPMMQGAAGGPC
jgi:hypothetical protein